jgi:glycosyltransferase involved in cell wall biosynthesis
MSLSIHRPLKFLHVTTFYPPYSFGGDAMYLYRLAHALGDAGHSVDVLHCVDSYHLLHPGEPEVHFEEHPRVTRHELRSPFGWLSPLLTQQTGRPYLKQTAIRRVLASKQFDVIHFHNMSLVGPEALKIESSVPAVKMYTTHEHWLICPMHVLWKFDGRPCETPECLKCTLKGRRPPQLWRYTGLLERASAHVDQFVSPSRFTARTHAERGFPRHVAHLPYFIPRVDNDWRNPGPRPQEAAYFLFVGRLELIKGLQTLIHLWNTRKPPYDLLVAGTGAYGEQLRALAAGNPRIRFLGPLPQRELGALYHHAIASIIPSITYETFGMINIESFARKTPVIARDLGALPEAIDDTGGGFIYRSDDELLFAMDRIAGSPALRAELGEKGYCGFLRWWTTEAHMDMYFDFLQSSAMKKFGCVPWEQSGHARLRKATA